MKPMHFLKRLSAKICNAFSDIVLYKFPLRKAIVFECESDFDDNPRAVYEYLIQHKYNYCYKLIWLVKNVDFCKKNHKRFNVKFINRFDKNKSNQRKLLYYLTTSKYFIFSHPYWFYKRRQEQVIVHINHGSFPIKARSSNFDSSCIDYLLASSHNTIEANANFWNCCHEKVFVSGLPRLDFFKSGIAKKDNVIKKLGLGINNNEKVIMCMPTFKQGTYLHDSDIVDPYLLSVVENDEQLHHLNGKLCDANIHLIAKIHPLQSLEHIVFNNLSNIHYLTNSDLLNKGIILYELLGCCDALLTDFSSVCFDFLMMNKPIGFFLNNYHTYTRGYMMDNPLEYMPGEKIYTFSDFIKFISDFSHNNDIYENERIKLCEYINGTTDFNESNCKKIIEWLFNEA